MEKFEDLTNIEDQVLETIIVHQEEPRTSTSPATEKLSRSEGLFIVSASQFDGNQTHRENFDIDNSYTIISSRKMNKSNFLIIKNE